MDQLETNFENSALATTTMKSFLDDNNVNNQKSKLHTLKRIGLNMTQSSMILQQYQGWHCVYSWIIWGA